MMYLGEVLRKTKWSSAVEQGMHRGLRQEDLVGLDFCAIYCLSFCGLRSDILSRTDEAIVPMEEVN